MNSSFLILQRIRHCTLGCATTFASGEKHKSAHRQRGLITHAFTALGKDTSSECQAVVEDTKWSIVHTSKSFGLVYLSHVRSLVESYVRTCHKVSAPPMTDPIKMDKEQHGTGTSGGYI
jgi:hypothetical protein